MSNETNTTTFSSRQLTESIMAVARPAHTPKNVIINLVNTDSIDGLPTDNAKLTQHKDIGQAADLSENSDLQANTELEYETPTTVTPSEIGLKATITRKAIRRSLPGVPAMEVADAIQRGDLAKFTALLQGKAGQMLKALDEKREDILANLLATSTNSVGNTGVDLTSATMINAQYTMKTLEPEHEAWGYVLTPNQIQEIQLEQGTVSGATGAVWFNQADVSMFNFLPDMAGNGRRGSFMNIPIWEYSHSLRTLMNSGEDVAGALLALGAGSADDGPLRGSISLVEGAPPIFDLEGDGSLRAAELVLTQELGAALADPNDADIVTIVSDAP